MILAAKDLRYASFQVLLPLAHLCRGQLIGLSNLINCLEALKGFHRKAHFEFRGGVSSLSFLSSVLLRLCTTDEPSKSQ